MNYSFQLQPYKRNFRQPLKTSHGTWKIREGIIISIKDNQGKLGIGEIAPIPWFGSETLGEALSFCKQLGGMITEEKINAIPDEFPCCKFGFESALEDMSRAEAQRRRGFDNLGAGLADQFCYLTDNLTTKTALNRLDYSYLLPAGEAVLAAWQNGWNREIRTFKWKIGVESIDEEIKVFHELIRRLPEGARLRLDANGGLLLKEAQMWLTEADKAGIVEFLEQPLHPQKFDSMLDLSCNYATLLALDESVANLRQLEECYQKGWRGIYVIKAAIMGSPKRLRQFCQQYKIDAVFSTVFETQIGRQAVLNLAAKLSNPNRALGFGLISYLE
ncbi:MAG: o-succinylbenzoate synthase [Moorea sp. SIO2B7]|nr:o-succinylbenzoate synthase [Moorena sp. SIO2B7]